MASSSEFEGKSVDAAVRQASRELNIPEAQLEYEVLSSGSSGIFGLVGVKNAKIRVFVNNYGDGEAGYESPSMAQDRQDIQSLLDETFADTQPDKVNSADTDAGLDTVSDSGAKTQQRKPSGRKSRARKPSLSKSDRKPVAKKEPAVEETAETDAETTEAAAPVLNDADFEQGKVALQKILDVITSASEVAVSQQNNQVLFTVTGGNSAVLIGKRGKTLKAIQHLIEKIVRKSCGENVNVQVDVEQYLEKREASLRTLALRLAEKTRQTGKPSTINRIDAFERKIVHDVLRKDKRVRTRSVGSGNLRNVVIHPGKKAKRKQQQSDEQSA